MPARHSRVLVTGASGFVGSAFCRHLVNLGYRVRGTTSRKDVAASMVATIFGAFGEVPDLFDAAVVPCDTPCASDWIDACRDIDVIVHLAGRVHVMRDSSDDLEAVYRKANVDTTLALALCAAESGVKRFVFVSSVLVNGSSTERPFSERDVPRPKETYAASKLFAEQGLQALARETGLDVVVLRPPLIYGPGVGANFLRLMRSVDQGWPMPFGRVDNRRSLLYLGNFTDAIRVCLDHPAATGQTFLVSDGEDVSSAELIRRLALAMHRPARLLPVPPAWLRAAGALLGRRADVDRLLGSLCVDSTKIQRELGWRPPFSMDEGLRQTADNYFRHIDNKKTQG